MPVGTQRFLLSVSWRRFSGTEGKEEGHLIKTRAPANAHANAGYMQSTAAFPHVNQDSPLSRKLKQKRGGMPHAHIWSPSREICSVLPLWVCIRTLLVSLTLFNACLSASTRINTRAPLTQASPPLSVRQRKIPGTSSPRMHIPKTLSGLEVRVHIQRCF